MKTKYHLDCALCSVTMKQVNKHVFTCPLCGAWFLPYADPKKQHIADERLEERKNNKGKTHYFFK